MSKDSSKNGGSRFAFGAIGAFSAAALGLILSFKCNTDEEVKRWKSEKEGFIILSEHPSKLDAAVLAAAAFPRYTRFVTGAQHLNNSMQGNILRYVGVIPKKQFTPDLVAIKEMMKTVKSGNVLGMMPEGRVSMDGVQNNIDISTAKLVKTLGCNVAVLIPHGSYFVKPPYRYSSIIPGPVSCDLKVAMKAEDVKAKEPEEILEILQKALSYNTMEDPEVVGAKYGSKANPCFKDVSKILYLCPKCGELYTMVDDGATLKCKRCGMEMGLGQDPFFITDNKKLPKDIAAWNKLQLEFERRFWKDKDAKLSYPALKGTIILGENNDFVDGPRGTVTLNHEGLSYEDEEESFFVELDHLPGISADYQEGYLTYYEGKVIRRFKFDDVRITPRYVNSLSILKGVK